jgi:hypothetical protein
MPEVRYLKVFKGMPEHDNPDELTAVPGLKTIRAPAFPHTETRLVVIALVKLEPDFSGAFRIRIPDTSKDYWDATVENPKQEAVWLTLKYGPVDVAFRQPGDHVVDLSLDGSPIHRTILRLEKNS